MFIFIFSQLSSERCRSIGANNSWASKTEFFDSMVRRQVSCQEARVSEFWSAVTVEHAALLTVVPGSIQHTADSGFMKVRSTGLVSLRPVADLRRRSGRHIVYQIFVVDRPQSHSGGIRCFFARKIERICFDITGFPPPTITSFRSYSQEEVYKIFMSSPIKSCSSDTVEGPAPAYLSDECHLTSSAECTLCVPLTPGRVYLVTHTMVTVIVDFATAGPSLWNSLLLQLREPDISFNFLKLYWRSFCFRWRRSWDSATNCVEHRI